MVGSISSSVEAWFQHHCLALRDCTQWILTVNHVAHLAESLKPFGFEIRLDKSYCITALRRVPWGICSKSQDFQGFSTTGSRRWACWPLAVWVAGGHANLWTCQCLCNPTMYSTFWHLLLYQFNPVGWSFNWAWPGQLVYTRVRAKFFLPSRQRQQSTTNKNSRCTCCRWGWLILIELPVPDLLIQSSWNLTHHAHDRSYGRSSHQTSWAMVPWSQLVKKAGVTQNSEMMMYDVWMSISGCWNVLWKMRQQTYSKTKVSISLSLYIYRDIFLLRSEITDSFQQRMGFPNTCSIDPYLHLNHFWRAPYIGLLFLLGGAQWEMALLLLQDLSEDKKWWINMNLVWMWVIIFNFAAISKDEIRVLHRTTVHVTMQCL